MKRSMIKASAPGRLDVMGGIADYSGSLVLQKAITQQTFIELTLRDDYQCYIVSQLSTGESLVFNGDYRDFMNNGIIDYDYGRQKFKCLKENAWVAYVLGCALVLQKEKGIDFKGADIKLVSQVPNGKGVASSASVEVACMQAMGKAYDLSFGSTELPVLAQRVENYVVGAPCGLMDQLASFFGKPDSLLPIHCQPDQVRESIEIPHNIHFIGIDSGIRHSVAGASYSDVRCAAFMGYAIVANALGLSNQDLLRSKQIGTLPYNGYLCNITLDEFNQRFEHLIPESIKGISFLEQYGDTTDSVTVVDPDKTYNIKSSTLHPVYEHHRVKNFLDCLVSLKNVTDSSRRNAIHQQMGKYMLAAHESYSVCGLGTVRTDTIVKLAMAKEGIMGARVTGGGNGGTICLMAVGKEGLTQAHELHRDLCEHYGEELAIFI
ncbi:MAG: GHMP kinase [Cytophagia bacterium]|nr:GHMP kinase [Cytophagia bacterium]